MPNNDDYRILCVRNEASLHLDDLVALVDNSTLANQLRAFSAEIMERTPGFTLSLKQAQTLKKLIWTTLKKYERKTIGDEELMSFYTDAQTILRGDSLQIGGNKVNILYRLTHRTEIKRKDALEKTELEYQNICKQIANCQEEMQRCIDNSTGLLPDSADYRNNERTYNDRKNRLTLLKKQELTLRKVLADADQMDLVREFATSQARIMKNIPGIFGSEKERNELLALAQMQTDRLDEAAEQNLGYASALLKSAEEENNAANSDSEFSARVAASERRQATAEMSGIGTIQSPQTAEEETSEFAKQVAKSKQV